MGVNTNFPLFFLCPSCYLSHFMNLLKFWTISFISSSESKSLSSSTLRTRLFFLYPSSSSASIYSSILCSWDFLNKVNMYMVDKFLDSEVIVTFGIQIQFRHLRTFTTRYSFWKSFPNSSNVTHGMSELLFNVKNILFMFHP